MPSAQFSYVLRHAGVLPHEFGGLAQKEPGLGGNRRGTARAIRCGRPGKGCTCRSGSKLRLGMMPCRRRWAGGRQLRLGQKLANRATLLVVNRCCTIRMPADRAMITVRRTMEAVRMIAVLSGFMMTMPANDGVQPVTAECAYEIERHQRQDEQTSRNHGHDSTATIK